MLYSKYFLPKNMQENHFYEIHSYKKKKSGAPKNAPDNVEYQIKDYFQPKAEAPSTAASAPERLD